MVIANPVLIESKQGSCFSSKFSADEEEGVMRALSHEKEVRKGTQNAKRHTNRKI